MVGGSGGVVGVRGWGGGALLRRGTDEKDKVGEDAAVLTGAGPGRFSKENTNWTH